MCVGSLLWKIRRKNNKHPVEISFCEDTTNKTYLKLEQSQFGR